MFTNTLLCMSLTRLIIKLKLRFELGLFTKQMNINKYFSSQTEVVYRQLSSFITPIRDNFFFFFWMKRLVTLLR